LCFLYPDHIKKTAVYQKRSRRGFRRKRNKALDFNYAELINIAAELSWFPPKRVVVWGRRTTLAGFVHRLRDLRNYVHPGVLAPKVKTVKFTKGVFTVVFEIFRSSQFVALTPRREEHSSKDGTGRDTLT
jgi:hypothetical protein